MNKNELILAVAEASGLSRGDATKAVESVFDTISSALTQGDEVRLVNFGTFSVAKRKASTGRNQRADGDQGFQPAQVQARQGAQGCGELRAWSSSPAAECRARQRPARYSSGVRDLTA